MGRPHRIEFPGALYHMTSRGNGKQNIYTRDHDRRLWLGLFHEARTGNFLGGERWIHSVLSKKLDSVRTSDII